MVELHRCEALVTKEMMPCIFPQLLRAFCYRSELWRPKSYL